MIFFHNLLRLPAVIFCVIIVIVIKMGFFSSFSQRLVCHDVLLWHQSNNCTYRHNLFHHDLFQDHGNAKGHWQNYSKRYDWRKTPAEDTQEQVNVNINWIWQILFGFDFGLIFALSLSVLVYFCVCSSSWVSLGYWILFRTLRP